LFLFQLATQLYRSDVFFFGEIESKKALALILAVLTNQLDVSEIDEIRRDFCRPLVRAKEDWGAM
jgi:hypothetical protein